MRLREASVTNPVTNIILDEMEQSAPVLRDLEFYRATGSAPTVKQGREPGTGNVGFRSINEDQVSTGPTRVETARPKKIMGFEAKVDRVLEDRNEDVEGELEQETRLKAEEAGYLFQEKFFEGDSANDAEEFDGLRALVKAGKVVTPAAPLVLSLGGDSVKGAQMHFMEEILRFFARVPGGATHAYFNADLLIRMIIVAKALGYYRQSKDAIDSTLENDMIGETIVRSASRKYNGDPLLPFGETLGAANDTSSAFAVRHAERRHLTAVTSVGVNADYEGLRGKFHVNTMDLDMATVLQHDAAIWQLKGLRMPTA